MSKYKVVLKTAEQYHDLGRRYPDFIFTYPLLRQQIFGWAHIECDAITAAVIALELGTAVVDSSFSGVSSEQV